MNFKTEISPFNKSYTFDDFDCGVLELNKYLTNYTGQDIKRHLVSVFVCTTNNHVIGYYTLSAAYIDIQKLDESYTKNLPYYPYLPAALIGRLAVDKNYQGKKIGEGLLIDGLNKVINSEIAAFAAIVEAKNSQAVDFYKNYGFIQFIETPNKLFLPTSTISKIFPNE